MKPKPGPSQARLREVILYEPVTGHFSWRLRRSGINFPRMPGNILSNGYRRISIDNISYLAHRLAWLYMTGIWPPEDIDHANLERDDNRWSNLRLASRSQNMMNRPVMRSGLKGTVYHKNRGRWSAQFVLNGRVKSLGYFDREVDAHKAYCLAAAKHYGEFARFQ